jgi:4-hydroxy-tetrahydrodipicolinate synthase
LAAPVAFPEYAAGATTRRVISMTTRFGSVVTAMVTPFRDDFTLDLDGAQALATYLLDNGSDTLLVAGTTGEGPTVTHEEKDRLLRAVIEAARGRGNVWCNTGTYNTEESVELTREAEKAGADAALCVTPYYNRPPQRGLIAHFTEIAESTKLPLVLYNIPGRTGTLIEYESLLRLAEVENIVGVKDSTGDLQTAGRIISETPDDFDLYSGDDWATFPLVCMGAAGIVSVASHLVGREIKEMVELAKSGDVPSAWKIHARLLPLFNGLFITSNPIPVKAALEIAGRPVGPPRLPLVEATPEERTRIEQAMREVGAA